MWYHVRAKDTKINNSNGMIIEFWLYANSKEKLNELLKMKHNIKEIEWIKQKIPPFTKENK